MNLNASVSKIDQNYKLFKGITKVHLMYQIIQFLQLFENITENRKDK